MITCICTQVCPLYGNFIYLSGPSSSIYISMNVITVSDLVENSTLCLNSGSDSPEKWFTKNQFSGHHSIEPHQLIFSVFRYEQHECWICSKKLALCFLEPLKGEAWVYQVIIPQGGGSLCQERGWDHFYFLSGLLDQLTLLLWGAVE